MNHILNEALRTSSSVGPVFLNSPMEKSSGNFSKRDLPKEKPPRMPMKSPVHSHKKRPRIERLLIFTPKCAGLIEDQNSFLCSANSGVSSAPGRPSGCSVTFARVLFTTTVSAEGNFITHNPSALSCSISDPLGGGGPGICTKGEETLASNVIIIQSKK
uniref:Uncharacterized protein n=1 Tax=Triticum urartu TaxID=4572 RepID=A0A8R7PC15_TRIUA